MLTVGEVAKQTGKSKTTIYRFIKENKDKYPSQIILKEKKTTSGTTREYLIKQTIIEEFFTDKAEAKVEQNEQNEHLKKETKDTSFKEPKGYKLIPIELYNTLNDQLKNFQQTNKELTYALTRLNLLQSGVEEEKPKEKAETGRILTTPPSTKKTTRVKKRTKKRKAKKKKGFFQKLFS